MLLLLLPEYLQNEYLKIIGENNPGYSMDDLFDIKLGMIEDRYHNKTADGKEEIYFLSISSFESVPNKDVEIWTIDTGNINKINLEKLKYNSSLKKEKLSSIKEKKRNIPLSHISPERILTPSDYLISIRGKPTGFSLYNNDLIKNGRHYFVASNHFVQLRPRNIKDVYVPYMHLVLDLLVTFYLKPKFEIDIKKLDDKSYGSVNPFGIRELRQLKIDISKDMEEQMKIYNDFLLKYKEFLEITRIFNAYQKNLFESLKINR